MKIVAISDTHGQHRDLNISGGDVLIHCGDFVRKNNANEVEDFISWFSKQAFSHKILISGNHDRYVERNHPEFMKLIKKYSITYLENTEVTINGLKFYGSPFTKYFGIAGSFMYKDDDYGSLIWSRIPSDTDILITHGPPYGMGDLSSNETSNSGCKLLAEKIRTLKLTYHFFGHIHEGYGIYSSLKTIFVNSSITNCAEALINEPVEINL
jgi:Icc-related predicted phosphoesterase